MADSTLGAIRTKVRRLTRSLSESQLSTSQIDEYINTFVLYDFPEHLRLFNLRETFSFYTEPYVDQYGDSTVSTDPLFEFSQRYISVHSPVYIAGFQAWFCESRDQFFGVYPLTNSIASIGTTGDGVTTTFTGVVNASQGTTVTQQQAVLLRNNVLFDSVDANGNGLALIDYPVSNTTGALGLPGQPQTLPSPFGQIDYVTGAFTIVFPTAPASGQAINSQTIPVQPSLPQAMLFFDGMFTLRPVPDQPYKVDMEVYVRPTELLQANQEPKLEEWWQYIAYGASRKVFQDRMDMESLAMIEPEYKKQELLIQRRTIVQYTSQRPSTIYQDQSNAAGAYGPGWWNGGGNF